MQFKKRNGVAPFCVLRFKTPPVDCSASKLEFCDTAKVELPVTPKANPVNPLFVTSEYKIFPKFPCVTEMVSALPEEDTSVSLK